VVFLRVRAAEHQADCASHLRVRIRSRVWVQWRIA